MGSFIFEMSCDSKNSSQTLKKIFLVFIAFNMTLMICNFPDLNYNTNENSSLRLSLVNSIPLAWEWYRTCGTEDYDRSYDVQNDSMNNIYVLGRLDKKIVLLIYNRSGDLIYNNIINDTVANPSLVSFATLSIDSQNNLYIVGDKLLMKVNSSGVVLWQKGLVGYTLYGITIDKADCVILTGSIGNNLLQIKLNNSGEQLWNTTWNGLNGNCGYDIAIDDLNNIIVTGETNSFYNWWDMQYNADIPILKFNSSGNLLWNVTWTSPYDPLGYKYGFGNAIILDSNENIYITGYSYRWPLILCYNQSDGSFWYDHIRKEGQGVDLEVDTNDNIFVLASYGYPSDSILIKYSNKGKQLWSRIWGGNDDDDPNGMILFSSEEVFVVGSTNSYTNGNRDIVLVKFGPDTDNDRISDFNENTLYFTDPFNNDTDNEGIIDGLEVEIYNTNPNKNDTDDDLLSDYDEIFLYYTDPNKNETDGDLLSDYDEIFLYYTNPNKNDTDGDLLTDYDEIFIYYTDPNKYDTDSDGFSDYDEIFRDMTDPNNYFSNITTYVITGILSIFIVITILFIFNKKKNIFSRLGKLFLRDKY